MEASGRGTAEGCGLFRGWYRECKGTRTLSSSWGTKVVEIGDGGLCPVEEGPAVVGEEMLLGTAGGDEVMLGATAIWAGLALSKLITVVGFVLASEFCRLCPSSEVYDAPTDEPIVSLRVAGGGDVVRPRSGAEAESESERHNGTDPVREMTDPAVGEGGIGRTDASSSATRPASAKDTSSAMEMRGPLSRSSEAILGVRERVNTLIEGRRDPESIVEAGYDLRKRGTGIEG